MASIASAVLLAGGCRQRASVTEVPQAPPVPPTYATGTTVAGINVGGLTEAEAGKTVRSRLAFLAQRKVTLTYGKHSYVRRWQHMGTAPDLPGMLKQAWSSASVPLSVAVSVPAAKASIRRAARALDIQPVEPHFIAAPSKGWTRPGRIGRKVDVSASAALYRDSIQANPSAPSCPLVVVAANPKFTEDDLALIREKIITFSTRFNPGEINRTHNLQLVARRLNGGLVAPGAVFSFNEWVGERRISDGFREAIVYKSGKMVRDTGGGLCQVSSTLYNVALLAGFPIRQRSHHSLTVSYVPLGRDATVYWGTHDLCFENDTESPVYFRTRVSRSSLTIEAWGTAPLTRRVKVTSVAAWRSGQATARVYRTISENGKSTRELISDDRYDTHHVMASTPSPTKRT